MKQSTHSHSPISPISRKLRSDSKLSALPPEAQSLLLQKLEIQSYQETASWLQDTHKISVSPSNLSTFRSRHLENQALKEAYLQSATFHCTLQDLQQQNIDPGDPQVEAAVRRLFLFKVVNQGDIGTYLHFTRVGNESKKLALTQAREERLQQERQDAQGGFEAPDDFTSLAPDSSKQPVQPLSLLLALNQRPKPGIPPTKSRAGVGTSRPHTVPQDSNHSESVHPRPCPKTPCSTSTSPPSEAPMPPTSHTPLSPANSNPSDPTPSPVSPDDLLDSFQQALDAVMPLDGAEPVTPSSLDPFYAAVIGTVIGRMLDLVQAGKFPYAASSPSAAPAPGSDQPSAVSTPSPESTADSNAVPVVTSPNSEAETLASSPSDQTSSPSNSLKYPQTPPIRSAAFFLPDRPAPCPNHTGETKDSYLS